MAARIEETKGDGQHFEAVVIDVKGEQTMIQPDPDAELTDEERKKKVCARIATLLYLSPLLTPEYLSNATFCGNLI